MRRIFFRKVIPSLNEASWQYTAFLSEVSEISTFQDRSDVSQPGLKGMVESMTFVFVDEVVHLLSVLIARSQTISLRIFVNYSCYTYLLLLKRMKRNWVEETMSLEHLPGVYDNIHRPTETSERRRKHLREIEETEYLCALSCPENFLSSNCLVM